jgi:hypothetical protein
METNLTMGGGADEGLRRTSAENVTYDILAA